MRSKKEEEEFTVFVLVRRKKRASALSLGARGEKAKNNKSLRAGYFFGWLVQGKK